MTSPEEDTQEKNPCPCAQCSCRRLIHPTLGPTLAETWLLNTKQAVQHHDSEQRDDFVEKFGYAILNRDTVETLRPYAPILEVAAGTGYWAYELQKHGIDTVPTDPHPEQLWPSAPWTTVHHVNGLHALEKYPEHNLLISWPDMARWPTHIVRKFRGKYLIYVGEPKNGSTGTDRMFQALADHYTLHHQHVIPTFATSNDRMLIYIRNACRNAHHNE